MEEPKDASVSAISNARTILYGRRAGHVCACVLSSNGDGMGHSKHRSGDGEEDPVSAIYMRCLDLRLVIVSTMFVIVAAHLPSASLYAASVRCDDVSL